MDLEQTVTISTPEGVQLELTVAGMGSRIAAATIDFILEAIVLIVAFLALSAGAFAGADGTLVIGFYALLGFLIFFGYPIVAEAMWEGRTIGKALIAMRVVRTDGGGIGFLASLIRNVLRLIDFLPSFYGVGLVVAMVSEKGQRLGDLAADTMVVKVRSSARRKEAGRAFRMQLPAPASVPWDVSAVTTDELATLRHYAERRSSLDADQRARLADTLYGTVKNKVVATSQVSSKEGFILQVIAEKDRNR